MPVEQSATRFRATNAPHHPSRRPQDLPRTAREMDELLARGRMLRGRAVQAMWIRFRRRRRWRLDTGAVRAPFPRRWFEARCSS